MIDELEKLRPKVPEALDKLGYFLTGTHNHNDFYIIRAELLRLAAMEHAWQQWIKDGMRVEFLPPELPK